MTLSMRGDQQVYYLNSVSIMIIGVTDPSSQDKGDEEEKMQTQEGILNGI